jgi:hypothetical protein
MPIHGRRTLLWSPRWRCGLVGSPRWRCGLVLGVLGSLVLGLAGCDLASLAYFMMPDAREPALIKDLGTPSNEKKKQENRVAILTYAGVMDLKMEFLHADRQLSDLLGKMIQKQCEDNDEKITMIPTRTVENFKNNHPDWRQMDLEEIGRQLKADYVIYLELNSLSLYEEGALRQLFRGRANVSISLIDVNHPDEMPEQQILTCVYPTDAHGPMPVDADTVPEQFRRKFLEYVAKRLTYYFTRYQKRDSSYTE